MKTTPWAHISFWCSCDGGQGDIFIPLIEPINKMVIVGQCAFCLEDFCIEIDAPDFFAKYSSWEENFNKISQESFPLEKPN